MEIGLRSQRKRVIPALHVNPVGAARRLAGRLLDIVNEGESPLAPAIMAAAAFAFIAPLVALVIFLALTAAHYAS